MGMKLLGISLKFGFTVRISFINSTEKRKTSRIVEIICRGIELMSYMMKIWERIIEKLKRLRKETYRRRTVWF